MFSLLMVACVVSGPGSDDTGPEGTGDTRPSDTGSPAPEVLRLPVQLSLPLVERELFETLVGVDHDPVVQDEGVLGQAICLDYLGRGFPHCYDEHGGNDYILRGGFDQMDAGSARVVAAADGVVLEAVDGNYDRCHGDLESGGVDCDGFEMVSNSVVVQHQGADGSAWRTLYWHLKRDSVRVEAGQEVVRGQELGLVGSSGKSSMPHLHFELRREQGEDEPLTVNPYAGPYSQEETGWCDQGLEGQLPGDC